MAARNVVGAAPCVQWAAQMKVLISTWSRPAVEGRGGALSSTLREKEPELQMKQFYRVTSQNGKKPPVDLVPTVLAAGGLLL